MVSWRGELGKLKKGMHAQEVVDCVATSLSHGTEGGLGVTDRAQPGSERFGVLAWMSAPLNTARSISTHRLRTCIARIETAWLKLASRWDDRSATCRVCRHARQRVRTSVDKRSGGRSANCPTLCLCASPSRPHKIVLLRLIASLSEHSGASHAPGRSNTSCICLSCSVHLARRPV